MNLFSPFDYLPPFSYPTTRYVVVSETEYAQYQQERAEQEIKVLESKMNRYNSAIAEIEAEITKIREAHVLPAKPEKAVFGGTE